ncbi:zinc-dependent alcohol dehydrogenase family protein [Rhizobium sp. S152]|uniref:zinc-dependent alcohol dehydrogenase family protein n=1 Tax=Rhizobium sp. S152 TaxID=3055038 RepID=UPI0025AA3136|nr:zinc-dependent alcohol dehydrogenase family protein [Rhizobium sp. S152]MDM9628484.1 zinc-dependent alcohol dehydrogenase family protein [Rhizobium sp. S152]
MRGIQLSEFGGMENLKLAEIPEPAAPGQNDVLLGMEYAPINFNDLLLVSGKFPRRPSLPSAVGNEGVGRVLATGSDVTTVKVGDRVIPPLYSYTWRERMIVPQDELFAIPENIDPKQAAMLRINPPTAALMLSEHGNLRPGDWVVQNAATSGVGKSVIAFAKARGFKTINLVRRPESIEDILSSGGDIALLDNDKAVEKVADLTKGGSVRLAIDGVSGRSTVRLLEIVSQGASLVSYAFSSGEVAIQADLRPLLRKAVSLFAFYQARPAYDTQMPTLLRQAVAMVSEGTLKLPVAAVYPMSDWDAALAHFQKGGKVLLDLKS